MAAAELFGKFNCTNCQDDIQGVRVQCSDCEDFQLCLQCFAAGAEIGPHKNTHRYQFMDSGNLSIYRGRNSWSAREQLHLLDAIEQYGFGNWEDISKHIETKSPEDGKEEYIGRFLIGTVGRHTWLSASENLRPNLFDHTLDDHGPLSQITTQRLPPIDVSHEEAIQIGYMPNRDDFEREYDMAAEQLVSTLSLSPDDEDTDLLLKLAQVDIYTRRLRERARRKRLVRDYQLVSNFYRGRLKRTGQNKEQRELRDRFRVFAQFYTSNEFERLLASLEREKALNIRLSELHRYRWNGLTRVDECVHFEQHAAAAQQRNTGPYGHGRTDNRPSGERPGSSWQSQQIKRENVASRSTSSTDRKSMLHIDVPGSCDGSLPSRNCLDDAALPAHPQPAHQSPAGQPGGSLLSTSEIKLCSNLNMPATRFITLKTVLLSGGDHSYAIKQESSSAMHGDQKLGQGMMAGSSHGGNSSTTVAQNNSSHIDCIKKYLTKAGWLSAGN